MDQLVLLSSRHEEEPMWRLATLLALALWPAYEAQAQGCSVPTAGIEVYVAQITESRVRLAWGRTNGTQTIGYSSPSLGQASVYYRVKGAAAYGTAPPEPECNWIWLPSLLSNTQYEYYVCLADRRAGQGVFQERRYHGTG